MSDLTTATGAADIAAPTFPQPAVGLMESGPDVYGDYRMEDEMKFKHGDKVRLNAENKWYGVQFPALSGTLTVNGYDGCSYTFKETGLIACEGRLELAATPIDPAKKYRTLDGSWEVIEFITTSAPGPKPIVVAMKHVLSGKIEIWSAYPDGRSHVGAAFDLVEVKPEPKVYEGWVNIYRDRAGVVRIGATLHASESAASAARESMAGTPVACPHLTFPEGEGL